MGNFDDLLHVPNCFLLPPVDCPFYLYLEEHGLKFAALYLGSAGFFVHTLMVAKGSWGIHFIKFGFFAVYWISVFLVSYL